jgi:hypothetical protein
LLQGDGHGFGTNTGPQFAQNRADMEFDCSLGDGQLGRDLLILFALGQQD